MEAHIVKQVELFSKAELENLKFLPEELAVIEAERVPDLDSISFDDIAEALVAALEARSPSRRPPSPSSRPPSPPPRPPSPPPQPRYLQVSRQTLINRGWNLRQGNAFWPANDPRSHIHLGVNPSFGQGEHARFAEDGNVFVRFVAIKINDQHYGRLSHNPQMGYFAWIEPRPLPNNYRQELIDLGILR